MAEALEKGARVRLTEEAIRAGIRGRAAQSVGTVISGPGAFYTRVKWDSLKSIAAYHPDYIERAPSSRRTLLAKE